MLTTSSDQSWPMTNANQGSMASSGSYQRPRSQISNPRPIMSNCKETQQTSANSRHSSKALNSNSKPSSKAPNSSSKPSSKALNSSSSRPPSRAQCDQAPCDMWTVISLWSRKINHNVFVDMTLSIYCRNTPLCKHLIAVLITSWYQKHKNSDCHIYPRPQNTKISSCFGTIWQLLMPFCQTLLFSLCFRPRLFCRASLHGNEPSRHPWLASRRPLKGFSSEFFWNLD